MRTTLRWVLLLGCVGFVALYILQYSIALAVTPLIAGVGLLAGLVIAKWLPWSWYGRQFAAGVRAGTLACGLAAAGVLLSLVGTGTHAVQSLADHSHTPVVDIAPLVITLGAAGWFLPYLLLSAFFALVGILVAGFVAQIMGWSKSVSTARVITAAHTAASTMLRNPTWGPTSNSVPSVGGYWNSVIPSAGPASQPGLQATGTSGGRVSATHAPMSGGRSAQRWSRNDDVLAFPSEQSAASSRFATLAPLSPLDFEDAEPLAPLAEIPEVPEIPEPPQRHRKSSARPVHDSMTDDLRSALERWDSNPLLSGELAMATESEPESVEPKKAAATKTTTTKPKVPAKRQPKASAYLNSAPPAAPRRNRKKQQTRDWLC